MNVLINSGRTQAFVTTRRKLISSIISKGHRVVLTGYQEGFEKEIEALGATFIQLPFKRAGISPINDIGLIIKYYRIIRGENIQLVHSYTIKPNIYGSMAARLAGLRQVFPTLNGIGYAFTGDGAKARMAKFFASILYWITFKCSKAAFFHNQDDIQLMVNARLIKANKCVLTLGSGIDMAYFSAVDVPLTISFVLISRLLKTKGVMEYIKAAQEVKQKYPEVEFNLVGPTDPNPTGIKTSDIQAYIDNHVLNYHGSQSDVRSYLRAAAVLVLPSYREGIPLTVLEAMSTGRAILTTDVPGCRETVIQGDNGFLVRPYHVEDLVEKMTWMIENPDQVKVMGQRSRLLAKELFEDKKVNQIILKTMELE